MIPNDLKINGVKLGLQDITGVMSFPGLPAWKYGVVARWPLLVHIWFHESSGWNPVSVDAFNSHGSGWLKGSADGVPFDLPHWTGRSFWDDDRLRTATEAGGYGIADWVFQSGMKQPEQNLTYITGSGNMRFWQPEEAWVNWYGKTAASAMWFNAYRAQDVMRPRWNLAKNGLPERKEAPGFDEWDQANGLNGWDSQHLDAQEECAAVVLYGSAPHLMAAVNLWNQVRYNSKSLAMVNGQEHTGSSRVPGWYLTFAAQLLRALRSCDMKDVHLILLRDEIIADVTWHVANCLKIHPMVNPWYYGSFSAVKEAKKDYWVPYQFGVKWWGCLNLIQQMDAFLNDSATEPELLARCAALKNDLKTLANKIHAHILSCWLPDKSAFAEYMTTDYSLSSPMYVPGVASWLGPPSMLAKTLGLNSAPEFELTVKANESYFGLDPLKAAGVNLLRPEIEKTLAIGGKK